MTIKVIPSDIVTAFSDQCIGSKVTNHKAFWETLILSIPKHDYTQDIVKGQSLMHIPALVPYVSSGLGKTLNDPNAYVLKSHRGKVHAYLQRKYASPVTNCGVVIYTKEAYLKDPDLTKEEESRVLQANPTHVLVAILATSEGVASLTPYRFVKNLAGGNLEALAWSADEIRARAKEIAEQTDNWSVVSDP